MYLKASYSVEGTAVISICLIIIGFCILTAFDMYKQSVEYIELTDIRSIDAPEYFYRLYKGEEFLEGVF